MLDERPEVRIADGKEVTRLTEGDRSTVVSGQLTSERQLRLRLRRPVRLRHTAGRAMISLATLAGVVAIWELISWARAFPRYILPTPLGVGVQLIDLRLPLLEGAQITGEEILIGFAIGSAAGILVAMLVVYSKIAERVVMPLVVGSQAIPKIAVGPLFVLWFGLGMLPTVVIAALLAFFPVVINSVSGLSEVDPAMVLMARATRASAALIFWKIRAPLAAPAIFSGLRLAITLSAIGTIVGEFIASGSGLGTIIETAQGNENAAAVIAAVVVLAVLTLALYNAVALVEYLVVGRRR